MAEEQAKEEVVEDRGDALPEEKEEVVAEEAAPEKEVEEEPTSGQTIPFARFRAQNVRLREAEKRAEELAKQLEEAQNKQEPPAPKEEPKGDQPDLDAALATAEKKLRDALADNDADAILEANRELRAIDRQQIEQELATVRQETQQTQESVADRAFEEMLSMVEGEFPALDPTSPDHDTVKQQLVQDLLTAYEAKGMGSDDALLQATAMAFPDSELAHDLLGTEAQEEKAKPKAEPKGIAAKIAAAKATPPDLNKAGGEDSDAAGVKSEVDITKLTDEEFDALPSETQKRARGDYIST